MTRQKYLNREPQVDDWVEVRGACGVWIGEVIARMGDEHLVFDAAQSGRQYLANTCDLKVLAHEPRIPLYLFDDDDLETESISQKRRDRVAAQSRH